MYCFTHPALVFTMCMQMCAEPPPGIAASASAAAITAGAAAAAAPPASGPQADLLASLGLGGTGVMVAAGPHVPPVGTELRGCSKGSEKVCMGVGDARPGIGARGAATATA